MVAVRNVDSRWIRRYKVFFIIGIFILVFQLFLAFYFIQSNSDIIKKEVIRNSHKLPQLDINDVENSVNSARRAKDGMVLDDEDKYTTRIATHHKATNKTRQNKTNIKLRLEELDFVPPCEITSRESISAIHRAKTQKCKQDISNVTCLIQQKLLYPVLLETSCPSEMYVRGRALGCFKDEKSYRLLNGYYSEDKVKNSPDNCINMCLQSGFQYAGVQYS